MENTDKIFNCLEFDEASNKWINYTKTDLSLIKETRNIREELELYLSAILENNYRPIAIGVLILIFVFAPLRANAADKIREKISERASYESNNINNVLGIKVIESTQNVISTKARKLKSVINKNIKNFENLKLNPLVNSKPRVFQYDGIQNRPKANFVPYAYPFGFKSLIAMLLVQLGIGKIINFAILNNLFQNFGQQWSLFEKKLFKEKPNDEANQNQTQREEHTNDQIVKVTVLSETENSMLQILCYGSLGILFIWINHRTSEYYKRELKRILEKNEELINEVESIFPPELLAYHEQKIAEFKRALEDIQLKEINLEVPDINQDQEMYIENLQRKCKVARVTTNLLAISLIIFSLFFAISILFFICSYRYSKDAESELKDVIFTYSEFSSISKNIMRDIVSLKTFFFDETPIEQVNFDEFKTEFELIAVQMEELLKLFDIYNY